MTTTTTTTEQATQTPTQTRIKTGDNARLGSLPVSGATGLKCGYRVFLCYHSEEEVEDYQTLAEFPHTPAGLRQTHHYLEKADLEIYDRFDRDDVTILGEEFVAPELQAVPFEESFFLDDTHLGGNDDQFRRVQSTPSRGFWPVWDRLRDEPTPTRCDITEDDANGIARKFEAHVHQLLPKYVDPLAPTFQRLRKPMSVAVAVIKESCQWDGRFTAQGIQGQLGSEDVPVDDLVGFVTELTATRDAMIKAVTEESQRIIEQVPPDLRQQLTEDLGIYIVEELATCLVRRATAAARAVA